MPVFVTSPQSVANSLPAGAQLLVGSDPTCRVVQANVEYQCTLATPPAPDPIHLTPQQQMQIMIAPANFGPVKTVNGIARFTPSAKADVV